MIVSSLAVAGHPQRDGRSYVAETHLWSTGAVTRIEYGPVPDSTDYQAVADARARALELQAAVAEFEALTGGD